MDEGSSSLKGSYQLDRSTLENTHCNTEPVPMVEEITSKEDSSGTESGSSKGEGYCLKMDVSSPDGKMDVDSPKTDIASPKMEATSLNMEISSPSMEMLSPNMEVSSPNTEEGSAKIEEVAMKMGEVSVKWEECANPQEKQGTSKMEEVAVKMGEVSVKAESKSITYNTSEEKGSVKLDEVSVKMEKVSVQSDQISGSKPVVTSKTQVPRKKRVLFYRGTQCIAEGDVPDWLTVDILVRAILNDKPGTKKPQIRPFGTAAKKRKTAPPGGKFRHQIDGSFSSPHLNWPSGNHSTEPTSSHGGRSSSQSISRASSSKAPTSEGAGKPSTSQSSSKLSSGQSVNKPSSSSLPDRPLSGSSENKSSSGQSKGKAGAGGRIKGKSSLSSHKGKASMSEANVRSADIASGSDEKSPIGISDGCSNVSEGKSEESMELADVNKNIESQISEENQVLPCNDKLTFQDVSHSRDIDRPICNVDGMSNRNLEENYENEVVMNNSGDDLSANRTLDGCKIRESSTFQMCIDASQPFEKSRCPPDDMDSVITGDLSGEPIKRPTSPSQNLTMIPSDSTETIQKSSELLKVRFEELPVQDSMQVENIHDGKASAVDKSTRGVLHQAVHTTGKTFMKPDKPFLRVTRFISQRLSRGNTVYRVCAFAVCGCVVRDCRLVVKRCSNVQEVIYYKKIAPRIPYVPRVLLCEENIVVMDDLVHEGFRRPLGGKFTPAQMTVAIDGLARMHTASVIALKRDPSLLEAFPQAAKASESDIARDLRALAERVKSWPLQDADYYASRCRALAECVPYLLERLEPADTNMTVLLHGNVSPRNVFFLYDSRNPKLPAMASFVDFANVYWGHPALDVSLVTGPAGGFWEGYKIVLLSLLTRASGRMWMPQPEVKDCGETYAFALLRAICPSVSSRAARVLETKFQELFPMFRQYSWLDFW